MLDGYRLSSSSAPSGHSNGNGQGSNLLTSNSIVVEITLHKFGGLMATGYLKDDTSCALLADTG